MPAPTRGPTSMAVGANDIALGDLRDDAVPISVQEALADRERLIRDVGELEDNGISLAGGALAVVATVSRVNL